eukprot:COSAG06_NODE_3190_length_5707_cov_57.591655_9_plen_20_part_01
MRRKRKSERERKEDGRTRMY